MEAQAPHRVLIVAGEASGDRHGGRLIEALRSIVPLDVHGIAGPELVAAGVRRIAPASELAVVGFTGVLSRLPRILAVERQLLDAARRLRPAVAVLVDTPGFNFRVGPKLKRLGCRIFYYIAPQVWAWHAERAARMARWVDRLGVVFPFEEPLFRDAGVTTRFVGHPLVEDLTPEVDAETLRARLGLAADARILGLLPGSRRGEIRAHLPVMVEAARALCATRPGLKAVLALAPGLEAEVPAELRAAGAVLVAVGLTHAVQATAECCLVASGTATLETALFGTPLVVVYRTSRLNYAIARRLVTLRHIGLPNIVAGEEIVPERIQDRCSLEELVPLVARVLDDPEYGEAQRQKLHAVRERLGSTGAARNAAEFLRGLLP